MSEDNYDDIRKRNIAERDAILAEIFKDFKEQKNETKQVTKEYKDTDNLENQPPRKRRKTVSGTVNDDNFKINVRLGFRKKYNTRSRAKNLGKNISSTSRNEGEENEENEENEGLEEPRGNRRKLHVLFSWAKPFQRSIDLMKMGVCDVDQEDEDYDDDDDDDDDNDFYNYPNKKRVYKVTRSPYDPNSIPSVDEITEDMLNNIAEKSSSKDYSSVNGTSCHQCRQKTLDTKTVCRSGECIGVRGQFCGPCLKGRYGESAVKALKDPNWACPPCRGLCNCSICRTRSGLRPTGILAPVAQGEGYSSVMDYLKSTEIDDT